MGMLRNTVLIRADLKLPVGLLTAQVAHLAMERFRQRILQLEKEILSASKQKEIMNQFLSEDEDAQEWLKAPYLFVHAVPNREVLAYFEQEARAKKIVVTPWFDTITLKLSKTQKRALEGVQVGSAFGPCESDKIKAVISDLPLL